MFTSAPAAISHGGVPVRGVSSIFPAGLSLFPSLEPARRNSFRAALPGTLSGRNGRTPHSEPAADKPSETKAFPQPSSAPFLCTMAFPDSVFGVRHD
ncbi:hypothetical protein JOF48_000362 [Arthrobacter stackebrandtii]|uniref:Uncharacterized protein n=1 Tax=Arthrobacter stackebrandtii TaxID=272161 RepID=A0ABS4YRZ6_9MICC|nr:hypothetical protein [Arthrobacter stackebrandtii]PYG99242.1 hypothetical protein CVV67_16080 [Arthrobacter stackebrandtii]